MGVRRNQGGDAEARDGYAALFLRISSHRASERPDRNVLSPHTVPLFPVIRRSLFGFMHASINDAGTTI
jgi:hypothetical protein